MKIKKWIAVCLAETVGLLALTGCSNHQASGAANEISFSLDGISEVAISYDEEHVTFYESDSGRLVIKEYMTENKSRYYGRAEQGGGRISISEGGKPFFKDGFSRWVEVYVPASYRENLTVTTTEGDVDFSALPLSLKALRVDSTAGTVSLNTVEAQNIHLSTTRGRIEADSLKADSIRIDTTSGRFSCENLDGYTAYTTTSGSAEIRSAIGSGDFRASNSGELRVTYTQVTGDLAFYNKNDDICLTLPAGLEFRFEAASKNGSIATSFQECISVEGRTASGIIGGNPAITVKAETNNGNIVVNQGNGQ